MRKEKSINYINNEMLHAVRHGFFTRVGGVSTGEFASLNCSLKTGEDASNVASNRALVAQTLGYPADDLKLVKQIHSNQVVTLSDKDTATGETPADALVTNVPGVLLGVQTADCSPILFMDSNASVIGAAHAGWRGAHAGIIQNTIVAMEQLGAKRQSIVAVIGPMIGQKSYEVDSTFKANFIEHAQSNERFFIASNRDERFMFDLTSYCLDILQTEGVVQYESVGIDTYAEPDKYFSCRYAAHHGNGKFGGQLSVIGL